MITGQLSRENRRDATVDVHPCAAVARRFNLGGGGAGEGYPRHRRGEMFQLV